MNRLLGKAEIAMIAIALTMAYSLWFRIYLPFSYLFGALLLGALSAESFLRTNRRGGAILRLVVIFVSLRNVYSSATRFSAIPFGDPYWNYGVISTFSATNHFSVIEAGAGPSSQLTWYSAWPLLGLLGTMLSRVSGVDAFYVVLLFPTLISTVSLILVYLIVENVRKAMKLNDLVTSLAILFYAISADTLFWPMRFTHQNLGILFLTALIYLLLKFSYAPAGIAPRALFLLVSLSLVLDHHFTSFIATAYLILLLIMASTGTRIANRLGGLGTLFSPSVRFWPFLDAPMAMALLMLTWWTIVGTIILAFTGGVLGQVFAIFEGLAKLEFFVPAAYYPSVLTPSWAEPVMFLRDALLYVPAPIGFIFLVLRKSQNPQKFIVTYSLFIAALLFMINLTVLWVEPYRLITLFMPFIAICTSLFYARLTGASCSASSPNRANASRGSSGDLQSGQITKRTRKAASKYAARLLVAIIIVILVSSSFVALWGHRYVPAHLYEPSINMNDVGEHKGDYLRLRAFFSTRFNYSDMNAVLADDIFPLYVILPSTEYSRINTLSAEHMQRDVLVVQMRDLNIYEYYYSSGSPPVKPAEVPQQELFFRNYTASNLDCVYSDGDFRIWHY